MEEIKKLGLEAFGDLDKFNLWLELENMPLGNKKPIDLLNDDFGKNLVIIELTQIKYGILV